MNVRRYINSKMWRDTFFEELTTEQKLIWIWLLTNDNTNMAGIYEISLKRMAFEIDLDKSVISQAIDVFTNAKKVVFYENYIVLCNFIKHQKLNPNQLKSAINIIDDLPQNVRSLSVIGDIVDHINKAIESLSKPSEALPKPMRNMNMNMNKKKILKEKDADASASSVWDDRFNKAWLAYRKNQQGKVVQVGSKQNALSQFNKILDQDKLKALHAIACEINATPSGDYRPHLSTLLNAKKQTYLKWDGITLNEAKEMGKSKTSNDSSANFNTASIREGIYD